jgi:uncharacterized membrane protein YcaP (DUF421 family)
VAGLVTLAWNIILRTVAVYLVILVGLRLAGKREIWPVSARSDR